MPHQERFGRRVKVAMVRQTDGGKLDWPYIHRWSDIHGTRQLLEDIQRALPRME